MQKLTGIGKNPFPFHGLDEDEPPQDARDAAAPAGAQGASRDPDSDEEEDDGGPPPAPAPAPAAALLPIEWDQNIDTPVNALVWQRAALLVFQTQTVRTLWPCMRDQIINFYVRIRLLGQ